MFRFGIVNEEGESKGISNHSPNFISPLFIQAGKNCEASEQPEYRQKKPCKFTFVFMYFMEAMGVM